MKIRAHVVALLAICFSLHAFAIEKPTFYVKPEWQEYVYIKVSGFNRPLFVTGDGLYPLSVIRNNLGITEEFSRSLVNKTILSVGEGFSDLLPYLLKIGAQPIGIDLWYEVSVMDIPQNPAGHLMAAYLTKYGPYLKRRDALKNGFPDSSFDFVFSHMVINNFETREQVITAVREMVRVLKVGGQARITGYPNSLFKSAATGKALTPSEFAKYLMIQIPSVKVVPFETFNTWNTRLGRLESKEKNLNKGFENFVIVKTR